MASPPAFSDFAKTIAENAAILDEFFSSSGVPKPSFTPEGPPEFPAPPQLKHIVEAREVMLEAANKLYYLALGPIESLFNLTVSCYDSATLRAVYKLEIANIVPIDGEISYAEIAQRTGIDEDRIRRVLRFCICNGLFRESRPGFVSHTGMSAVLSRGSMGLDVNAVVGHVIDDMYPASAMLAESMKNYPQPKNRLIETPFALFYNTKEPFFDYMGKNPERSKRFHAAMRAINTNGPFSGELLANEFDWEQFGAGTIVDCGGSSGHTTLKIAKAAPKLNFIVQDLNQAEIDAGQANLPAELRDRVKFMRHNFFEPQTAKGADVYFFRLIFHDWPDEQCIQILRNLVPALKSGARILICDHLVPEPGTVPTRSEKETLVCDMHVLSLIGSCERSRGAWETLFITADPRLKFAGATQPAGSLIWVIEAVFEE